LCQSRSKIAHFRCNRRLKSLEDENTRLKKLVADQALDLALMKELVGRKW
jgi:putative transposase